MSEFYIGYLPKPPERLLRFLKRLVAALGLTSVAIAAVLLLGQQPFVSSAFEFGTVRAFEGVIATHPYPALLVARPGSPASRTEYSRHFLVATGKHGADELVAGLDGQRVRLEAQLIYRDGTTMLEVVPASIQRAGGLDSNLPETRPLGTVHLSGEIVDSKCYLGVMNPGNGKVHRDCAARCLSGGLPPLFVTADGRQYLLVSKDREPLDGDLLREFIAEPLSVTGALLQRGDQLLLTLDPGALRHTPDGLQGLLAGR